MSDYCVSDVWEQIPWKVPFDVVLEVFEADVPVLRIGLAGNEEKEVNKHSFEVMFDMSRTLCSGMGQMEEVMKSLKREYESVGQEMLDLNLNEDLSYFSERVPKISRELRHKMSSLS